MNRLTVAELTSGVGALVLGVGLGALFPQWFNASAGLITFAGVVVHAFGMWDKHRLSGQAPAADTGTLTLILYWICWLLLVIVLGVVAARR